MKKLFALILSAIAIFMLVPTQSARADFVEDTDDTFSVIWLADTQSMAYYGYDNALAKMGSWIIQNKNELDIRYIVQTGDLVDNGAKSWQWDEFDTMYRQFAGKIPYISVSGNHDVDDGKDYKGYCMQDCVRAVPRPNMYDHGKSAYMTFAANGVEFVVLAIGFGAEAESVSWANRILAIHKDKVAILLVHDYLRKTGIRGPVGDLVYNEIVVPNANVRLVLCGHVRSVTHCQDWIDDDGNGIAERSVMQLEYNYQDYSQNCGQIRTMQFNTTDRSITITTYSPVTGKYYKDPSFGKQETFTIDNAF